MNGFKFKAKVIAGRGLGRKIGFPTANLAVKSLPLEYGVYLATISLDKKIYQGLMHWGPKKTFNRELSCEVYLKNFNKNIYGRTLEAEVVRKIREIKKFKNIGELKKQIEKDLISLNNEL